MATYVGTLGGDSHFGNEAVMYGLDGADNLELNVDGFSTIYGGEGDDILNFLDTVNAGGDMYGGSGNDFLDGSDRTLYDIHFNLLIN